MPDIPTPLRLFVAACLEPELLRKVRIEQERLARQLKAAIDAVQNDPRTLERLAREKLGYARTNEIVVRFDPAAPAPAPGLRR